jgi:hypothetical protein
MGDSSDEHHQLFEIIESSLEMITKPQVVTEQILGRGCGSFNYHHTTISVRESIHGGMGVFAGAEIPSGSLIISELPVICALDSVVASSEYSQLDGCDSIYLLNGIATKYSPEIESVLRSLHPVRPGSPPVVGSDPEIPEPVRLSLSRVLPPDISVDSVIRAVQLNSLGFYTLPELPSYDDHLRFLCGTGLYRYGSMFNHSCDPNTTHYSLGPVTFFRTNRGILPGDELTISYIGTDILCESKSVRDEFLSSRDFICACKKCTNSSGEEDPWVEELTLEDRIRVRMGGVTEIGNLLRNSSLIRRDKIYLKFEISKKLNKVEYWQNLFHEIGDDSGDLSTAIFMLYFLVYQQKEDSVIEGKIVAISKLNFGTDFMKFLKIVERFEFHKFHSPTVESLVKRLVS